MEMLYGCPFEKITFLPRIDTNSGFGRNWDTLWKKFNNGTFIILQTFNLHALGQKCHLRNCQFGTFDPVDGIWKFCGQIPSFEVLWMCHYLIFSKMCLSLFQIQNSGQKGNFFKRTFIQLFQFCFLVFPYYVNII